MKVLLQGRPGSGKTTVARRLVELLVGSGVEVRGFTTEEIREGGRRVGFAVEAIGGDRRIMAHVDLSGPVRVGKYGVDVYAFERVALLTLEPLGVVVIDEIGKMELASTGFRDAVTRLFDGPTPVVATVPAFAHPFTDALKRRSEVETISVSARNRDELPQEIARRLAEL